MTYDADDAMLTVIVDALQDLAEWEAEEQVIREIAEVLMKHGLLEGPELGDQLFQVPALRDKV